MSQVYQRTRSWPFVAYLAWPIAALILIIVGALPLLRRSIGTLLTLLNYPFPTDQLEGTLLHEARLLMAGQPLYQPLEPYRFVSAPYPPLHPLVLGLIDKLAGPHVFWSGRLISVAATLLIAVLIVLLARRVSGSWLAGMLGASVFLSAPPVMIWGARIKPDLFVYLWTTLGLLLTTYALAGSADVRTKPSAWRWSSAAAVCFALAFAGKQTAVVAPFSAGLALLLADLRRYRRSKRDPLIKRWPLSRQTVIFAIAYLVLAGGAWLLLNLITNGQFAAHVQGLHRSDWWSMTLVIKYVRLVLPYWPLMLLALALLFIAATSANDRALLPACYALVAPVTLLGAAEIGANTNHLLETILALSIGGSCALGLVVQVFVRKPLLTTSLLALAALQVGLAYQPQAWFVGELNPPDPPERFLTFMRNMPGEILADDIGLLLQAGKPIRYDDPSTMGPAAVSKVWDERGLIDDITQRRFSAIMIPEDVIAEPIPYDGVGRWTAPVRAAIRQNYELKYRDRINTYIPKP